MMSEVKEEQILTAIDINLNYAEDNGVAYFRLTREFKEFLSLCNRKHGVIGFMFEDGSFNFGVILGKKKNENNNPTPRH